MDEPNDYEDELLPNVDAIYNASMEEYYENGLPGYITISDDDSWWNSRRDMDYDIDELEAYGNYQFPERYGNYQLSEESNESESDHSNQEDDYREEDAALDFHEPENEDKEAHSLKEAVDKMEEFVKFVQNLPTPEEYKIRTEEEKGVDSNSM